MIDILKAGVALLFYITVCNAQAKLIKIDWYPCDLDNCNNCKDESIQCTNCTNGWTLHNERIGCVECTSNCKYCNHRGGSVTDCYECYPYYRLTNSKECTQCSIANCLTCELQGSKEVCRECASGYANNTDGTFCHSCDSGCEKCEFLPAQGGLNDRGSCAQCASKMYREEPTSAGVVNCAPCPVGCSSCQETKDVNGNSAVTCSACEDRYTLNDQSTCSPCGTSCIKCTFHQTKGVQCEQCSNTTYLTSTKTCQSCGSNCRLCEPNKAKCAECQPGYRLASGACIACPSHCRECSESAGIITCHVCDDRWTPKASANDPDKTCDDCPRNCYECTDNVCTLCAAGYALDTSGNCLRCPSNCHTCSEVSGVAECSSPNGCDYGYVPNSNSGSCISCPSNSKHEFCAFNSSHNSAYTTECHTYPLQFIVDEWETTCQACDVNCDEGSCTWNPATPAAECTSCADRYGVSPTDTCEPCPDNCITCALDADTSSFQECSVCDDGYFVETPDCTPCIANCDTCTTASDCSTCASGFVADATPTCQACPANCPDANCAWDGTNLYSTCSGCDSGYIANALTTQCLKCPTGCSTCALTGTTTDCSNGACDSGYAYDGGDNCIACPNQCSSCTYDATNLRTLCDSSGCNSGYAYRSTDSTCIPCPSECLTCTMTAGNGADTADTCTSCDNTGVSKYVLESSQCLSCPDNCYSCSYSVAKSDTVCDVCNYGYAAVLTATNSFYGKCQKCPRYCASCSVNTTDNKQAPTECDTALIRYEVNTRYCSKCPFNCAECTVNYGADVHVPECTKCDPYYTVVDLGLCGSCPTYCKECTADGNCKENQCDLGYGRSYDKKSCVPCSDLTDVDNCALCTDFDPKNGATCLSCFLNYHLSDNSTYCHDLDVLTKCNLAWDDPVPKCKECAANWNIRETDGQCEMLCNVCGALNDMRPDSECNEGSKNYTQQSCVGAGLKCMTIRREHRTTNTFTSTRGCFGNFTCAAESQTKTKCEKVGMYDECHTCCEGNGCNTDIITTEKSGAYTVRQFWIAVALNVMFTALFRRI